MNLKESYRYMNYLEILFDTAKSFLGSSAFVTTTTEKHYKSKVDSGIADEEVVVDKPYDVDFSTMDLVEFCLKVLDEKDNLSFAITKAKKNTEIDIDHSIAMNKNRQSFIRTLKTLSNLKDSSSKRRDTLYKINTVDGTQQGYYYDVDKVTTIDFDRKDVIGINKKLSKQCDEISTKLDQIQINTEVEFTPTWDINDSLEECILS